MCWKIFSVTDDGVIRYIFDRVLDLDILYVRSRIIINRNIVQKQKSIIEVSWIEHSSYTWVKHFLFKWFLFVDFILCHICKFRTTGKLQRSEFLELETFFSLEGFRCFNVLNNLYIVFYCVGCTIFIMKMTNFTELLICEVEKGLFCETDERTWSEISYQKLIVVDHYWVIQYWSHQPYISVILYVYCCIIFRPTNVDQSYSEDSYHYTTLI